MNVPILKNLQDTFSQIFRWGALALGISGIILVIYSLITNTPNTIMSSPESKILITRFWAGIAFAFLGSVFSSIIKKTSENKKNAIN